MKQMKFPANYHLNTARCRLRIPNEADIPHVFSATRYACFNDGMLWDPPLSEDELHPPLQRSLEDWNTGRSFAFTIERKDNSAFVGRIGIRPTPCPTVWNIGYWVHPTQQRQGLMTEAAQAVIKFGFEQLHANAIEACYATWNIPSRRLLERLGMVEVEYLEQGFQKNGKWIPEFRMWLEKS